MNRDGIPYDSPAAHTQESDSIHTYNQLPDVLPDIKAVMSADDLDDDELERDEQEQAYVHQEEVIQEAMEHEQVSVEEQDEHIGERIERLGRLLYVEPPEPAQEPAAANGDEMEYTHSRWHPSGSFNFSEDTPAVPSLHSSLAGSGLGSSLGAGPSLSAGGPSLGGIPALGVGPGSGLGGSYKLSPVEADLAKYSFGSAPGGPAPAVSMPMSAPSLAAPVVHVTATAVAVPATTVTMEPVLSAQQIHTPAAAGDGTGTTRDRSSTAGSADDDNIFSKYERRFMVESGPPTSSSSLPRRATDLDRRTHQVQTTGLPDIQMFSAPPARPPRLGY